MSFARRITSDAWRTSFIPLNPRRDLDWFQDASARNYSYESEMVANIPLLMDSEIHPRHVSILQSNLSTLFAQSGEEVFYVPDNQGHYDPLHDCYCLPYPLVPGHS